MFVVFIGGGGGVALGWFEGVMKWFICERLKGNRLGRLGLGVDRERYGQSVPLITGKRLDWDLGYSCKQTRVTSQLLPITQVTSSFFLFYLINLNARLLHTRRSTSCIKESDLHVMN